MKNWPTNNNYRAWSSCMDVQAVMALHCWQRLIIFCYSRIRVNICFATKNINALQAWLLFRCCICCLYIRYIYCIKTVDNGISRGKSEKGLSASLRRMIILSFLLLILSCLIFLNSPLLFLISYFRIFFFFFQFYLFYFCLLVMGDRVGRASGGNRSSRCEKKVSEIPDLLANWPVLDIFGEETLEISYLSLP